MTNAQSVIVELEGAIQSGSKEKRIETLRRVTDLLLSASDKFNENQIEVFDYVLGRLIENIESRALAELSGRLAPIEHAPLDVVRRLANDDEIKVAGPVLAQSKRLAASDLVDIAKTKSQAHLLAISGRTHIEESVTSVLVERGNRNVLHKLSSNPGASFSQDGLTSLLGKADQDEGLLEVLGLRADIPVKFLRDLLARASAALRARLVSRASPVLQNAIQDILTRLTSEVGDHAVRRQSTARDAVLEMNARGELNDLTILKLAMRGQCDEVVAALALMNSAPPAFIEQILELNEPQACFIPCMAAGLKWPTVQAILNRNAAQHDMPDFDSVRLNNAYAQLTVQSAQRTLRFWQVRHTVSGQKQKLGG